MPSELLHLDGSLGEGGGQVIRIALSLSALYRIPISISNIRAGRPKPGLSAQHLKGVELLQQMCNAEVTGANPGSTCLTFKPGYLQTKRQEFLADTKTAGCICLLIQIALPCALFAARAATYVLKGGTNVPFGPQIDYLQRVFQPLLQRFGAGFQIDILRRGYYPQGGGEVRMTVNPVRQLSGVELLDAGVPTEIRGKAYAAGAVNLYEAERMAEDAKATIRSELTKRDIAVPRMDVEAYKEQRGNAVGHGSGINLVCRTDKGCVFGGSGLGSRQRPPIPPGVEAANQLVMPILEDSCLDEHLQDQVVILMALAKGRSRVKIGRKEMTCHAETAIKVAEIMLKDRGLEFSCKKDSNGAYVLECNGLGFVNEFLE